MANVVVVPLPKNAADLLIPQVLWRILDSLIRRAASLQNFGTASPATIAAGVVAFASSHMTLDTEAAAITDDLDTITGGSEGDALLVRNTNAARTVVLKDGTGNIQLPADQSLTNPADTALLVFVGTNWLGVSFSNNA